MWAFSSPLRSTLDSSAAKDSGLNPRLSLRVFSNPSGDMWKENVKDIQGEILCVSQFTLMANTSKGKKPDFHRAMVRFSPSSLATLSISFIHIVGEVGRSITGHVCLVSSVYRNPVLSREDQG